LPRWREIAFPGDLPSQTTNPLLTARPNQQTQSLFDGRALRACATAPHCLPHQLIVDVDVRPHAPS
jgi:hypothetical protein